MGNGYAHAGLTLEVNLGNLKHLLFFEQVLVLVLLANPLRRTIRVTACDSPASSSALDLRSFLTAVRHRKNSWLGNE